MKAIDSAIIEQSVRDQIIFKFTKKKCDRYHFNKTNHWSIRNLDLLKLQIFKLTIIFVWPRRREYLDINCKSFIYTALPDIHVIARGIRVCVCPLKFIFLFFYSKRIEPWQNWLKSPLNQKRKVIMLKRSKRRSMTSLPPIHYLSIIVRLISDFSIVFFLFSSLSFSFSREPWIDTIATIGYRKLAHISRLLVKEAFSFKFFA